MFFEQTLNKVLLEFVTSKQELYTKLSKPNVKSFLQDQLYNDYRSPVRDWDLVIYAEVISTFLLSDIFFAFWDSITKNKPSHGQRSFLVQSQ